MTVGRIVRLALGEAGGSPWKAWPLAAGLALGVASLIFFQGLAGGIESILKEKVAGTLPDRIKVAPATVTLGPIQLEGGMDDAQVDACRHLPGVVDVYRQAHFPGPVQLHAEYGGQTLYTDLVLEGVDPGQVADSIAPGQTFSADIPDSADVPTVVPQALLDILDAGISANTNLPTLSPQALIGKHALLLVGTSSFSPGPHVDRHAVVVGVSDQLGVSGPGVPLDLMRRWTTKPIRYHTLTLKVSSPERTAEVVAGVHRLGLATPGVEAAARISTMAGWARLATGAFSLAILLVAGVGVSAGMHLQVREEARWIGLYRALGATRRDITRLYLARAGLLGLVGSLLGVVGGWLTGWGVENVIVRRLPPGLLGYGSIFQGTVWGTLAALAFGLAVSLGSGLWPALRAAALRPAEALRGDH